MKKTLALIFCLLLAGGAMVYADGIGGEGTGGEGVSGEGVSGEGIEAVSSPASGDALLLETGDYLLLEGGDKLLLE